MHTNRMLHSHYTNSLASARLISLPSEEFSDANFLDDTFEPFILNDNPSLSAVTPPYNGRIALLGRTVNSARGPGLMQPLKSRSSHQLDVLPSLPVTPLPAAILNGADIRTPVEFSKQRFQEHESLTPGHKIEKLELELDVLRTYTRLECALGTNTAVATTDDCAGGENGIGKGDNIMLQQLRDRVAALQSELNERRSEHEELLMYRTGLLSSSIASATNSGSDEADAAAAAAEVNNKL